MTPNGDEPLACKNPIFNDIDGVASLASNAKAPHCFFMVCVPNGLAWLQRLDCSNCDAL
jgi:hypothetical protein